MTGWRRWAAGFGMVVALSLGDAPPHPLNGSTDGRAHTCSYITDQGVTEHLAAFWARCGQP